MRTYTATITHGDQHGRTIGFPTVNLDPLILPKDTKHGVYATRVTLLENNQTFIGALYLGPRYIKNESHTVLEIFLLDFQGDIYGQKISFELTEFVRDVIDFDSAKQLQQQIEKDVAAVRAVFQKKTKS